MKIQREYLWASPVYCWSSSAAYICGPHIIESFSAILDLNRVMQEYPAVRGIEFLGMGYYHPLFPLIPMGDWKPQIERWKQRVKALGLSVQSFWPPEMGFCMEMIPMLKDTVFKYVVVDSVHVKPKGGKMRREDIMYKPHIAEYKSAEIVLIPRDREISNTQEGGFALP